MPKNNRTEIVVRAPLKRSNYEGKAKESKVSEMRKFFKLALRSMYKVLFGLVLSFFKTVNRKIGSGLTLLSMRCETLEHVDLMIKVFKWIVVPVSLLYVSLEFYFFGQIVLDSMLLGMLVFIYSNFLPDLPSIHRRKKIFTHMENTAEDLPWYKKYALLLFAPLFIGAFLCGIRSRWKTTETFHNFKSAIIYGAFLFTFSVLAFVDIPTSMGGIVQILSLPFYGLMGYLTHLRVDLHF